ncbi:MAG: hypothetical protein JW700_00970 [Candidatus Aenigmarchaeota archaeon]|nr:hypothetical protein [Candidatus Aenigmarchaeota archaeon]
MVDIMLTVQLLYGFFYDMLVPVIGETYLQLFVFVSALSIYAIFVWKFYKTLSKRDLFKIDLQKYNRSDIKHKSIRKAGGVFLYILKYGIIFPLYIMVWFVVLSMFMLLMTEEASVSTILLLSISVVSATRMVTYYKEDLSSDIAKLIPFALLAISLTNTSFFSIDAAIARLSEVPLLWSSIMQFLLFSIVLEWILRAMYLLKKYIEKRGSMENTKASD